MPSKRDRIFKNVGHDGRIGASSLSEKATCRTWDEYFRLRDAKKGAVPSDFMSDRPLNAPFAHKGLFGPK